MPPGIVRLLLDVLLGIGDILIDFAVLLESDWKSFGPGADVMAAVAGTTRRVKERNTAPGPK